MLSKSNMAKSMSCTALQLLLEEINFQRTKEMRLKDDSGFVVLQGNTYWTEIFVRHFLFQNEPDKTDSDDLLFFVRKRHIKGTSRTKPKYDTDIEVFRKDSRKLPIGDPEVDWEETVYLNLVIHQFNYTLTVAICTRTSPKELQVLRRHSQKVYASPSRRKMDTKGESEEITYPHICFMVDNFDEVFQDILVRDGEMVCVELVASDRDGAVQGVIFLGSIRYDALKRVYEARQSSLSSKVAQRMTFGLFNSGPQTRCEFVRMKGPAGKGFAEMAVTKPKDSGIETPTSEPGFCATDMWDSECEDELDEYYNYRHQRRLSDPSSNLNNYVAHGWKAKNPTNSYGSSKTRSENEGLDNLANEVSEIEAGDLRDDRPASSASGKLPKEIDVLALASTVKSPSGCSCFKAKSCAGDGDSLQLSEVYCPTCDVTGFDNSPACLTSFSKQRTQSCQKTLLNVESELEYSKNFQKKITTSKTPKTPTKKCKPKVVKPKGKKSDLEEYEIADDATELNECGGTEEVVKIGIMTETDKKFMIRVNGKEELPNEPTVSYSKKLEPEKKTEGKLKFLNFKLKGKKSVDHSISNNNGQFNGSSEPSSDKITNDRNNNAKYSTLPMASKKRDGKKTLSIPQRTTSDGTHIYYICDLPKRLQKELDDGAYNPLWTSKGSIQTFHFWKENKRQQSTPLNAYLTYVTLPWFSIAKDLLDHRETPILTF